jgi:hypothetical protein
LRSKKCAQIMLCMELHYIWPCKHKSYESFSDLNESDNYLKKYPLTNPDSMILFMQY